jgi:hypothetical protein
MRLATIVFALLCIGCRQQSSTHEAQRPADAQAALRTWEALEPSVDDQPSASNPAVPGSDADRAPRLITTAPAGSFYGDPCTVDCSGHEAGYSWAEDNDIEDADECGGNSQSFIEGCESYAEERQEDARAREEEEEGRAQDAETTEGEDYEGEY